MSMRISLHGADEQTMQREITERFQIERALFPLVPHHNIAPHARVAVITQGRESGTRYLEGYQWGLLPAWTPEEDAEHRLPFARRETLHKRRAFRGSFAERRCLVPVSGFFLFKQKEGKSVPLYIRPRNGKYFALAGVWDEWITAEGWPLRTVALITTEANRLLAPLGQRMPAVLRKEDEEMWLDPAQKYLRELRKLLQPAPVKEIEVSAVTARANFQNFDERAAVQALPNSPQILEGLGIDWENRKVLPPRKRLVRREHASPDGQVFFKTRSFTSDEYLSWHPVVDVADGQVFCDCPDFRFRHAPHSPRLATPQHWCKHIDRAVENCRRHGEIA